MATSMQPDNAMLSKLWDDIVKLHWQYMETDENLEKLDRRKKLEVRLKEFLCKIQHDRKFFLPVTSHVLKVSLKMKNFSASKALIGFESISQYANNLFTKPWRKEYRTIKMYSGFYQHEIAANLMDAEQLFIEMGYKLLPNQTLLLVGAICPDQVSNVSRDAMTAYVECQIMNEICCGLIKMQLSTPWPNILNFREVYMGDEIDAIKMLALNIYQRKHNNREKTIVSAENLYNNGSTNNCTHLIDNNQTNYCYQSAPPPPPPPPPLSNGYFDAVQQQHPQSYYNNKISNNSKGQSIAYGYGNCGNLERSGANNNSTHMPITLSHSKSLDHYDDHHSHHHNVHQNRNNFYQTTCNPGGRYASFDHQYCESNRTSAICDYTQQCASINNLNVYNIPGSRCALPYSLSNHLLPAGANTTNKIHQNTSSAGCNDCQKQYLPKPTTNDYPCNDLYCHGCGNNIKRSHPQLSPPISSASFQHQQQLPSNSNAMAINHYRDNSVVNYVGKNERLPNDRLIDFDDRPNTNVYANTNTKADYYERKQNGLNNDDTNDTIDRSCTRHNYQQQVPRIIQSLDDFDSTYAKCVKNQQRSISAVSAIIKKVPTIEYDNVDSGLTHHNHDNDVNVHLYSTNTNGKRKIPISSNSENNIDYDDLPITNFSDSLNSRESNSFDSADIDYISPITINPFNNCSSSPSSSGATTTTISNKNQDGVGSYESWNFVYKILERRGYNKDRGDLYVRGLDLNPVPDAAAEKKIIWDEDGHCTMTNDDEYIEQQANNYPPNKNHAFNNDNYVLSDVTIKPPEQYDGVHENTKAISTPSTYTTHNNYNQLNGSGGGVNELNSSSKQKTSINNVPLSHLENCQAVDAQRRQMQEHQMRQQKEAERQQLIYAKQQLSDKSKEIRAQKPQNHYNKPSKKAENIEPKHVKENGTLPSSYRTTSDSKTKRHSSVSDTTTSNNINEWSCKHCTFLNPNSKRICEICSKSKDFNLEAPKKSTATCI